MPLLSVIVPVYNSEKYICECVESILAQKFRDFELILVDDGSKDSSSDICDSFASRDSRVTVLHKKNGGVVSARKAGINAAKGKYAAFVDSDDWIEKDMYELMIQHMEEYNCDLVMCGVDHCDNDVFLTSGSTHSVIGGGYFDRAAIEKEILPKMIYSGSFFSFGLYPVMWNKLYKRELLAKHLADVHDSIRIGEDAACVYPYIFESNSLYFIKDRELYHYRRAHPQMTSSYDSLLFSGFKALYGLLSASDIAKSEYGGQLNYYFAYLMKTAVANELKKSNKLPLSKKLSNIKAISQFATDAGFLDKLSADSLSLMHRIYFNLLKKNRPFLLYLGIGLIRFIQKICR